VPGFACSIWILCWESVFSSFSFLFRNQYFTYLQCDCRYFINRRLCDIRPSSIFVVMGVSHKFKYDNYCRPDMCRSSAPTAFASLILVILFPIRGFEIRDKVSIRATYPQLWCVCLSAWCCRFVEQSDRHAQSSSQ
jgi:hypothetical protein